MTTTAKRISKRIKEVVQQPIDDLYTLETVYSCLGTSADNMDAVLDFYALSRALEALYLEHRKKAPEFIDNIMNRTIVFLQGIKEKD
jgi:hypothetical protein